MITKVAFFFAEQIALIDLSENLPFFFIAQNSPIKMFRVFFSIQISQIDLILLDFSLWKISLF